jgi:hypothetical protein
MTSGAKKLWINPVHRSCPSAVLRDARLSFDKVQSDKFLSAALAGRIAEVIRLESTLFAVTRLEAPVGMPEPTLFIRVPVGEMTEHHEEVALSVAERFSHLLVIEWCMRCEEKV